MRIEAVIFDGDHGVLQVRRDAGERNIQSMFLERKPGLAVGAVEIRLSDAARELIDGERIARHPDCADDGHKPDRDQRTPEEVLSGGLRSPHWVIL